MLTFSSTAAVAAASGVAVGNDHACLVTTSGAVQCWGSNSNGQLGDNTFVARSSPVAVSGLSSGVSHVTAGWLHSCALTTAGGVRCWGANFEGQLGNGSTTGSAVPVNTTGLTAGVASLTVGQGHSCAVTTAGALKCWGSNTYGQLGDGTTTARTSPIDVTGLSSGVVAVAAGNGHTCAVMTTGGAKCWGNNTYGQLGDGTTTARLTPVDVSGPSSGLSAIAGAYNSTCALTSAGAVKCWGFNGAGMLGDGTTTQRTTPVDVLGLAGVAEITAGWYHVCARRTDGALYCWGTNATGQLGIGGRTNSSTVPVTPALAASVQRVAAGGNGQTCAIVGASAGVMCWGSNTIGQLGTGTFGSVTTPVAVPGLSTGTTALGPGGAHSCVVSGGGAKCWGYGNVGQLGDGSTSLYRTTVGNVTGLTSGVTSVASGVQHSCALTSGGGVKCWGSNAFGNLGNGSSASSSTPVDVTGLTSGVTALTAAVASHSSCALTSGGGIKCWGYNNSGQLGDGTTGNRSTPVDVAGLTSGVTAIASGSSHSCALTSLGVVKCWGANNNGQLGNNTFTASLAPVDVVGLPAGVVSVTAGTAHTCAITGGGAVYCWGRNGFGQLGALPYSDRSTAAVVSGGGGYATVTAGSEHTCGMMTDGTARCWGGNASGELGIGSMFSGTANSTAVTALANNVGGIAAGANHTCARTLAGATHCWGKNDFGQVGNGVTSIAERPGTAVVGHAASATALSASVNPSVSGQSVMFTATVLGTNPTGTVNFTVGASGIAGCSAVALTAGVATCSTGALPIGSSNIAATYGGDVNNPASSSNVIVQIVNPVPATVALTSSVNPSTLGQNVTLTVNVTGVSPTGTVSFYDGATQIAGCVALPLTGSAPAVASCGPLNNLALGQHTITVSYAGDANNAANGAALIQTVTQSASAVPPVLTAGYQHACAISSSGALRCWGANYDGQVGDGTRIHRALPTAVPGFASGTRSVSGGFDHTCAVDAGGAVSCWGKNGFGQLGDGTTIDRVLPVAVTGLGGNAIAVATGTNFSCALLVDATVRCWGFNSQGQLGNGTTSSAAQTTPVAVVSLTGVLAIDAAVSNACALLSSGALKCWGAGRVGDGTTTARSTPTQVSGLQSGVAQFAVAGSHFCALKTDGSLLCWGGNGNGQLGDGTTTQRLVPTAVVSSSPFATSILSARSSTTCAAVATGGVKCWGWGAYGKTGTGVYSQVNSSPAEVVGLTGPMASLAVGGTFACAMTAGGGMRCWGRNVEGEFGTGVYGLAMTPSPVSGATSVSQVVSGGFHACTTDAAGALKCWGSANQGQMGNGTAPAAPQATPIAVTTVAGPVATMSLGLSHTCTTTTSNQLQCWGANTYGQLGDGTAVTRLAPVSVSGLATATSVASGYSHSCALTTSGGVKCWGAGEYGQIGAGFWGIFGTPVPPTDVVGLSNVVEISSRGSRVCARTAGGGMWCWGENASGALGDGTTTSQNLPVQVQGLASGVAAISAGGQFTCALTTTGGVKCWGSNAYGALGDGTTTDRLTPTDVVGLGSGVAAISTGDAHACALMTGGGMKCWGANYLAQIGDGTLENRLTPIDVPGLTSGVAAIAAGVQFTCAKLTDGTVKCWGDNQAGQIGDGTVGFATAPGAYVAGPSLTRPLAIADAPSVTAARDGTLIARFLLGMTGGGLTSGNVLGPDSQRTDPAQLLTYLEGIRPLLDIDGNGAYAPLSDGLLLMRYLLGVRGDALIAGALGSGATRLTAGAVESYLAGILP